MVYTFEYLQHFNINKPPKSSKLISRTKDMHEKYLKYKPNQLNLMLELFSNGNLYTIKLALFPYDIETNVQHYILWFSPFLKYKIYNDKNYIKKIINIHFKNKNTVYFMNYRKNRSINKIPHYHIFVKN